MSDVISIPDSTVRDTRQFELRTLRWHSLAMSWQIVYEYNEHRRAIICYDDYPMLTVSGPIRDIKSCLPAISAWMVRQADRWFTPWLSQLSRQTGLRYRQVRYGNQRSLWGSCSSNGDIRLNAKMLFLPARLARYVMIHELCHTVHMHHQPDFWRLVAKHEPDYRELKRSLRYGDRYVPPVLL